MLRPGPVLDVLAIVALAFALRLGMLLSLHGSVYGDFLLWDERTYDGWARAFSLGKRYDLPDQSALPAYVLSFAYRVFGASPLVARWVNVVLGTAACVPTYLLGRSLGGRPAAILSGLGAALYLPFVFFSATLLKEPLGLLLFATTLWLFASSLGTPRPHALRLLLLGAAAALAVEVRQNAILAFAAMPVLLAWQARRSARAWRPAAAVVLAVAVGYGAASFPLAVARSRQSGGVSTAVGGFNLYLGNHLLSEVPYYRPLPFVTSNPREQAIQFTIEASRREGRRLTAAEASSYWTREVLRGAREHPGAFSRKLGLKILAVLNGWEEADNHSIPYLRRFVGFLRIPLLPFWLVFPLGMAGLLVLLPSSGRARALALLLVLYGGSMVVAYTNMRVRAPAVLLLVPCAAAGLVHLWRTRDRKLLAAFAGAAALFGAVEVIPIPGAGDFTAHVNTHALNLNGRGRVDEARRYWTQSVELHGAYSDYARHSLAQLRLMAGDGEGARRILEGASESSFTAAGTHILLAQSWRISGDPARAVAELDRSLRINWGDPGVHSMLVELLKQVDPARVAEEERTYRYVESFYPR